MHSRMILLPLLGAAVAMMRPTMAHAYSSAPMTFCNKTNTQVGIAIGYHSPGISDPADHSVLTGPFVSRGWWTIAGGQCQTIDNPFGARYMFWFGMAVGGLNSDPSVVAGMHNHSTPESFCTNDPFLQGAHNAFDFENENVSASACDAAGGNAPATYGKTLWVTARRVDTWVDPTVNFTGQ